MEFNNSFRTRFKKVSTLKKDDYLQVGQWVDKGMGGLSRLLTKHGEQHVHLHGDNINQRFNKAYEAKRSNVMLPEEPQQVRMLVPDIPTDKLEAIKGICSFELGQRYKRITDRAFNK